MRRDLETHAPVGLLVLAALYSTSDAALNGDIGDFLAARRLEYGFVAEGDEVLD